jgi:hypothetical protein
VKRKEKMSKKDVPAIRLPKAEVETSKAKKIDIQSD